MTEAKNRIVSFDDEMLILVDPADRVVGYKDKVSCHLGDGLLHRAFSIFIFNSRKELLIQQRHQDKMLWPKIWANSCCSHPRKGEDLESSTRRRLREELGLSAEMRHLFTFEYQARYGDVGSEHEMCSVLIGHSDQEPDPNPTEIAAWRYIGIEALSEEIEAHPALYSPWLKLEWARLMADHRKDIDAL